MSDWQYKIPNECDESIYDLPDHNYMLPTPTYASMVASLAAEHDYDCHNGYERGIPYVIEIELSYRGKFIGLYSVSADPSVDFCAARIGDGGEI